MTDPMKSVYRAKICLDQVWEQLESTGVGNWAFVRQAHGLIDEAVALQEEKNARILAYAAVARLRPEDEPREEDIERIKTWEGDWPGLLKFMESIWPTYGVVRKKRAHNVTIWEFVTGGWSGCEEIIGAFYENPLAQAMLWESTHRGGLHVLMAPTDVMQLARTSVGVGGADDDCR